MRTIALHTVLSEYLQGVFLSGILTERIVDGAECTVAFCFKLGFHAVLLEGDVDLNCIILSHEVKIRNLDTAIEIQIIILKDIQNLIGLELLMLVVGNTLAQIAEMLAHLGGKVVAKGLFQEIADAALTTLRVDADDVGIVGSADILGIDRNIRYAPFVELVFLSVFHTLGNRILMRARESGKNECACIRCSFINVHSGASFIFLNKLVHVRKIELRINAVGIHIHRKRDNIYVSGALAITKERTFYTVSTCEEGKLGIGNTCASVVVRMQGKRYKFAVFEIFTHIFNLRGVDVRKAHFHGYGQIDNHVVIRTRFEYIKHCIADLKCVFGFSSRKGFGRIFKAEVSFVFARQLLDKLCAVYRNLLDLVLGFLKHLLTLCYADRIVEVNNCTRSALASIEGLANDMLAALSQHLHGHIIGDHIVIDQRAEKLKLGFACRRESNLDFLKSNRQKNLVIFKLFFKAHGNHKALVAVAHIHRAPYGRFFYVVFFYPFVIFFTDREISHSIFCCIHHDSLLLFCYDFHLDESALGKILNRHTASCGLFGKILCIYLVECREIRHIGKEANGFNGVL